MQYSRKAVVDELRVLASQDAGLSELVRRRCPLMLAVRRHFGVLLEAKRVAGIRVAFVARPREKILIWSCVRPTSPGWLVRQAAPR